MQVMWEVLLWLLLPLSAPNINVNVVDINKDRIDAWNSEDLSKLMDSSKLNVKGWKSIINLEEGIRTTYEWFLGHNESFKEIKY